MAQSNRCLIHLNKLASEMNTFSEKNKYIQHLYSSSATLKMINTSSDDETQPRLWNSPLTHSSADWARSEVLLAGWTTIGTFLPASCSLISASRSSGSIWVNLVLLLTLRTLHSRNSSSRNSSSRWKYCSTQEVPWTSTWTWGRILWRHRYQTAPTCRAPWIHTRCRSSVCSHHWGWSWRCWSLWISQQLLGCLGFYQDDASMPVSCMPFLFLLEMLLSPGPGLCTGFLLLLTSYAVCLGPPCFRIWRWIN